MIKKYGDIIFGGVVMLIAVVLFISTFSIRSLLGMNPGPDFMPKVASVMLFIVAAGITWEGVMKLKNYVPEEVSAEDTAFAKAENRNVLLSVIIIGFYVFSMNYLGFIISTIIYTFCQMVILTPYGKKKTYILYLIISLVCAFGLYLAFTRVLYLMLPQGLLRNFI